MPPRIIDDPEAEALREQFEAGAVVITARESFRTGFQRNANGNLSRRWDGRILTIFRHGSKFRWAVNEQGKVRFSKDAFEDEELAIGLLAEELAVG